MTEKEKIRETYKAISSQVDAWYPLLTDEWFTSETIIRRLGAKSGLPQYLVDQKLWTDSNANKQNKHPKLEKRQHQYRVVDEGADEVRWWESEATNEIVIWLPMGIQSYARITKPSVIILAGETGKGKTTFMCKTVDLNRDLWRNNMYFFEYDSPLQLKEKFTHLQQPFSIPPPFQTKRKYDHFEDVIVPDALNLVDYIRVDMNAPYAVMNDIKAILKKLGDTGIAVIGLQKPPGRDTAYGGEATKFDCELYISMQWGKITFAKIRDAIYQDEKDPRNLTIEFEIKNKVEFVETAKTYS